MQNNPKLCPQCQYPAPLSTAFCAKCGHEFGTQVEAGQAQMYAPPANSYQQYPTEVVQPKSKIAAGLLAIIFPYFGIHGFYIGNVGLGLTVLLSSIALMFLTIISFGLLFFITVPALGLVHIASIVQGILYLCASDTEFNQKYVVEKRWF
jgi:TM2 domain-containing membrane protein YozV